MIEYAIPSRARADTLVSKTLPLLRRLGISAERISVFVDESETVEYASALALYDHGDLGLVRLRRGALGMAAQRRAIHDHYPEDSLFVTLDDDLRDLAIRDDETTLRSIAPNEWQDVVETGFEMCESTGARIWGLYPVPNPYFMRPRIRTALTYIGGGLWGCVNRRRDDALDVTLEDKEDFERSIRCYLADGAVVRIEYVTWRTEGYAGAGGMQTDGLRTAERIRSSAEILVERYPGLATLNLTKKSGKAEIRLADRRPAGQGTLAS